MEERPKEEEPQRNIDEQVKRLKGNPNSQRSEELPVQKVTDRPAGAKTDSYFKKRDYE